MLWGGRWEGGSCLGPHVRIKDFKIKKIIAIITKKKKKRNFVFSGLKKEYKLKMALKYTFLDLYVL